MANELATVAQGEMTLQIAAATQFFKFEIQADGIQFRRRDSAGGPWSDQQTLFSLLGPTTPALRKGYVTFAGLPASPEAAFRTISLNYQPNQFTLNIKQLAPFALRENFQLHGQIFRKILGTLGAQCENHVCLSLRIYQRLTVNQ